MAAKSGVKNQIERHLPDLVRADGRWGAWEHKGLPMEKKKVQNLTKGKTDRFLLKVVASGRKASENASLGKRLIGKTDILERASRGNRGKGSLFGKKNLRCPGDRKKPNPNNIFLP